MFNFFKKKKWEAPKEEPAVTSLSFQDMKLQKILLKVGPNGNDTVLHITNEKNTAEFVLDKEQCVLLGAILHEYARKGNMSNFANILKDE